MLKNTFVVFVVFVAVISADDKTLKYTQVIQPASRQLPATHDGYQSDAVYPQQSAPYPMAYQAASEGIYPPASEEVSADTQAHQAEQVCAFFINKNRFLLCYCFYNENGSTSSSAQFVFLVMS